MRAINPEEYASGRWRRHFVSVAVWLTVVAVVVGLFQQRSRRFEVVGIAQSRIHQIAASCTGRLSNTEVELFQQVRVGQNLVVIDTILDNEQLRAQLNTAIAELEHLMAQLIPTQEQLTSDAANLDTDWIATSRRFQADVENARIRVLEIKTQLEINRIILDDLALEKEAASKLFKEGAVTEYELQKAQIQYNSMEKTIEENQQLLAQAEQNLKGAEQRFEEFVQYQPQHPTVDSALEVIHKEIGVQEKLIEELLAREEELVLQSPVDGVVSQIYSRAGDVVREGTPILTIAETRPAEIIAYMTEEQAEGICEGTAVELIKSSRPARIAQSQVRYVGPIVEQMPIRLWRNPNIPQWGRPVLVVVPPHMELTPGELVGIHKL